MCEALAAACDASTLRGEWLDMAVQWRRLGDDGSAQATLLRLMRRPILD